MSKQHHPAHQMPTPETPETQARPDAAAKPALTTPPETPETQARPDAAAKPALTTPPETRKPTGAELVHAIKDIGPQLTQAERDDIIRTVASLPPAADLVTPSPYKPGESYEFRVAWGEFEETVTAENDRHAWAQFCDNIKQHPSPKAGKVECLGPVKEKAA